MNSATLRTLAKMQRSVNTVKTAIGLCDKFVETITSLTYDSAYCRVAYTYGQMLSTTISN